MHREGNQLFGGFLILIVGAAFLLYFVFPFFYAAFAFIALVMTLISLVAWHRPRRFFHLGILPMQARAMISFGLVGAVLAAGFVAFTSQIIGLDVPEWLWPHVLLFGYTYGLTEIMGSMTFARENVERYEAAVRAEYLPPLSPAPLPLNPPSRKTFEYADWTDAAEM